MSKDIYNFTGEYNKKTFCVAPFLSLDISTAGVLTPCCEYVTDNTYRADPENSFKNYQQWQAKLVDLRKDLINGVANKGCSRCWQREESSLENSYRYTLNKWYHRDIIDKKFSEDSAHDTRILAVNFGNTCNLKCLHCGPSSSSSHESEQRVHRQEFERDGFYIVGDQEKKWFKTSTFSELKTNLIQGLDQISLYGGEPLMTPEALKFLGEVDASNIRLLLTTNATIVNDQILDLLGSFKSISICISIDGVGKHAEYIREGCVWEEVDENIKKLQGLKNLFHGYVAVNHVLQHSSIYTMMDVLDYCERNNLRMHCGYLNWPDHLSINGARSESVSKLIEHLHARREYHTSINVGSAVQQALMFLSKHQYDPSLELRFGQHTNLLDRIRNKSYNDVFDI